MLQKLKKQCFVFITNEMSKYFYLSFESKNTKTEKICMAKSSRKKHLVSPVGTA